MVFDGVQDCVRSWLQSRLDVLHSSDADPVLPLTRQFITVLRDTAAVLTPMSSISQYFARLGLDYYKLASIACDSKVQWQRVVRDINIFLIVAFQLYDCNL